MRPPPATRSCAPSQRYENRENRRYRDLRASRQASPSSARAGFDAGFEYVRARRSVNTLKGSSTMKTSPGRRPISSRSAKYPKSSIGLADEDRKLAHVEGAIARATQILQRMRPMATLLERYQPSSRGSRRPRRRGLRSRSTALRFAIRKGAEAVGVPDPAPGANCRTERRAWTAASQSAPSVNITDPTSENKDAAAMLEIVEIIADASSWTTHRFLPRLSCRESIPRLSEWIPNRFRSSRSRVLGVDEEDLQTGFGAVP